MISKLKLRLEKFLNCHCEGAERPSQSQSHCNINEITTSCLRTPRNDKIAFTLAEVMIVVVIIGVVAVFTMPVLLSEVSERVNSNRQANIAQKITKAVELMIVNGDYEGFDTTDEFVDKLQKYLKIIKRCNSNNLTQCWPSNTVIKADGTKFNVANAKTGRDLHTNNDTNNVGLVLADGASIILTYNPDAQKPSAENGFTATKKSLPIGGGKFKDFSYTSNATNAIDFVMDVNGGTGPNAETDDNENYYDIRSFKIASFSTAGCPGYKFNGVCVYDIGKDYSPIACTNSSYDDKYCSFVSGFITDYWAGARKKCDEYGLRLATAEEMTQIGSEANKKRDTHSGYYFVNNHRTYRFSYDLLSMDYNYNASNPLNVICVSK